MTMLKLVDKEDLVNYGKNRAALHSNNVNGLHMSLLVTALTGISVSYFPLLLVLVLFY